MSSEAMTEQNDTAPIESSVDEELLKDHSYDGIQEYDNPLPGWWTFLLWASIISAKTRMF